MNNDHLRLALKEKITEKGYTLHSVAQASGVPVQTLQRFLSGSTQNPSLWPMVAICKTLGCSLDELCELKPTPADPDAVLEGYRTAAKAYDRLDYLHRRVNRRLWLLAIIAMSLLFLVFASILAFDALNPSLGFFK